MNMTEEAPDYPSYRKNHNCSALLTLQEGMSFCTNSTNFESPLFCCCYTLEETLSKMAGIWCIIIAVVGATGNFLTLTAIPWACKNKIIGFERNLHIHVFIINLAFSDFLYCVINLPMYSLQYLSMKWPLGSTFCKYQAAFRYVVAFSAWMALGFVAISRCVSLTKPRLSKILFKRKRGLLVVLCIWLYGIILVIPTLTEAYGTFGYNRKIGKCDFVSKDEKTNPHIVFYAIGFSLPCAAILISYFIIWNKSWKSSLYLKRSSLQNRRQLAQRDIRMTGMILAICLCYLIFVAPISIMNIYDSAIDYPDWHLGFFMVYWFQYSLNFFIYAARSEQYRKAYYNFLCHFLFINNDCHQDKRRHPHSMIFVINHNQFGHELPDHLRRSCSSAPDLDKMGVVNRGFRMDYSVDIGMKDSVVSCSGTFKIEREGSQTIIIMPDQLSQMDKKKKKKFVNHNYDRQKGPVDYLKLDYQDDYMVQSLAEKACHSHDTHPKVSRRNSL